MKLLDGIVQKNCAASFLLGAAIWAFSPTITGTAEPWDAESPYYFLSLLALGLVLGLWSPKKIWAHYLGAMLGQQFFILMFIGVGPFILLGALFLAVYTVLVLIGALIGSRVRSIYSVKGIDKTGT